MRGLLRRRRPAAPSTPAAVAGTPGATATRPATVASAGPSACGLLKCPHCGLRLETLALRCPRCRTDIPLGCSGDCRACGKPVGRAAATQLTAARADEYARGT